MRRFAVPFCYDRTALPIESGGKGIENEIRSQIYLISVGGVRADYPLATAFRAAETVTYVAHNYAAAPITVRYSDGFELQVPAGSMATASAPNTDE